MRRPCRRRLDAGVGAILLGAVGRLRAADGINAVSPSSSLHPSVLPAVDTMSRLARRAAPVWCAGATLAAVTPWRAPRIDTCARGFAAPALAASARGSTPVCGPTSTTFPAPPDQRPGRDLGDLDLIALEATRSRRVSAERRRGGVVHNRGDVAAARSHSPTRFLVAVVIRTGSTRAPSARARSIASPPRDRPPSKPSRARSR